MTVKNFKRDQPRRIMRIQQEVLTDEKSERHFGSWKENGHVAVDLVEQRQLKPRVAEGVESGRERQ